MQKGKMYAKIGTRFFVDPLSTNHTQTAISFNVYKPTKNQKKKTH